MLIYQLTNSKEIKIIKKNLYHENRNKNYSKTIILENIFGLTKISELQFLIYWENKSKSTSKINESNIRYIMNSGIQIILLNYYLIKKELLIIRRKLRVILSNYYIHILYIRRSISQKSED